MVASGARRVTDTMILTAARVLAESSPALQDASASLLPTLADLRQVAVHLATTVGLEAQRAGVAPKTTEEELRQQVMATQWTPRVSILCTIKDVGQTGMAHMRTWR
jgi:malate dehydrogenase (oxaloacetate-decarboxylating)